MRASKKTWTFLLAFIFLLGLGCSTKDNETTSEGQLKGQGILTGTVVSNGVPKDGVLISAYPDSSIPGQDSQPVRTAFTNSAGNYLMSLQQGSYIIIADEKSNQKASQKVRLLAGTVNLDFVLTATGDLTGRITWFQSPQQGVVVFLYGTQFMAVTNSNGVYKIRGIPIGNYRVGVMRGQDDGKDFALNDEVAIEAGRTRDMGTIEGSIIGRFASIDYVAPDKIGESHDPNHPAIVHRYELFSDYSGAFYPQPGILVKFTREMDANSVKEGETVLIEAPPAFADRNLRWKFEWGWYDAYFSDYYQEDDGPWSFSPSPCKLTIIPVKDDGQKIAGSEMPVGKYVIRIKNTIKDKGGNPLYHDYIYSFEMRELMAWMIDGGDDDDDYFIPNGATGIDVGGCVRAGFTNLIDQNSVNLDTDLTITPALPGQRVIWGKTDIEIHGLYAENTSYAIVLASSIRTIFGDPIVNIFHPPDKFDPVTGNFTIQFTTASPQVAAMLPKSGSIENGLDEPVTLIFNTITDRDSVQEHIHVFNDTNGVEIPARQNATDQEPSYKLAWVPLPGFGDSGSHSDSPDYPYDPNHPYDCEECDSAEGKQRIGDRLAIFFPRRYDHVYRIELDGEALSFKGKKIAAFSGTFRTKVPRLVDRYPAEGEILECGSGDLYFRYNVGVNISEADFVLATDSGSVWQDVPFYQYSPNDFSLIPQSLPASSHFTLTMRNIKADDGSLLPERTHHFSTERVGIAYTNPEQGETGYYLDESGTDNVVTIQFCGQLTEGMKDVVENSIEVIGSYYGAGADPGPEHPNYPVPAFFWSEQEFGWSRLQIAFTMDTCTNYRIHLNTDPDTKALVCDGVPFLWVDKDLVFTTMCQSEEEGPKVQKLLYRTEPHDGEENVDLEYRRVNLYFAQPYISGGIDAEIWAGETQLIQGDDYLVEYNPYFGDCPLGHYSPWGWQCDGPWQQVSLVAFNFRQVLPDTEYRITVKGIDSSFDSLSFGDSNSTVGIEYNIPYTFSFTTEKPKIWVNADNRMGVLTFHASSGCFNAFDFKDPNIISFQPVDLGDANRVDWRFYRDQNQVSDSDYADMAELHYQPVQYALIKVQTLKGLDHLTPPEIDGNLPWTLKGQFANTPGEWILVVNPDIILPELKGVKQEEQDRYDLIRLYFNEDVDSETALDANNYSISYLDGNGATRELGIQWVVDHDCYDNSSWDPNVWNPDGWDPNQCDPAYAPPVMRADGQVLIKTDPQDSVEYTLHVTGVKNSSRRYEILPERGIAKFKGKKYTGKVMEVAGVETMHDIGNAFDAGSSYGNWRVRTEMIAIRFDVPMDPNTTRIGGDELILTTFWDEEIYPSGFEQAWYENDTITVITAFYAADGYWNYTPRDLRVKITEKCKNAQGEPLTDAPYSFYVYVQEPVFFSPYTSCFSVTSEPGQNTLTVDYSYEGSIPTDWAQNPGNYRLLDPNWMDTNESDPNQIDTPKIIFRPVLDCNGNEITVTSVTMPDSWPGPCVLTLSGIPATPQMILVFSGLPNYQIPAWFPVDALKDVGYSGIWCDRPPCGGYPPQVSIGPPWYNGETYDYESTVWFSASIYDEDDDSFPPEAVVWTSSLVGPFGTGMDFYYDALPSGTHDITVTVTDKDGNTASASITIIINDPPIPTNNPPGVSMSSPSSGAIYEYGDMIWFEASVYDEEDGELPPNSIVWTSSLIGPFGTGTSVPYDLLPSGMQEITVTVTDSDGNTVTETVVITINEPPIPTDTPPSVVISSPGDGSIFAFGDAICFDAWVYDEEDGWLPPDAVVWTLSSIGQIGTGTGFCYGTGTEFSYNNLLPPGIHEITVTVTDSDNNTATEIVTITINQPEYVFRLQGIERLGGEDHDYIRLYFTEALDSETALNADNYNISYVDGNGVIRELGIQHVLDYACYENNRWDPNGWDPNQCDPAYASTILPGDGQVLIKTDPQETVEYTLQVTGVKDSDKVYEILPQNGVATFQGKAYTGRVLDVVGVETMHDIRNVFDEGGSYDYWRVRAGKIAIQFDVPMDPNTTRIGGDELVITNPWSETLFPSWVEQTWYENNTVTVITAFYTGDGFLNQPPCDYTVNISERCKTIDGQPLTDAPCSFDVHVPAPIFISPYTSFSLASEPGQDVPVATLTVDYTYDDSIPADWAGNPANYRLLDPNRIDSPEGTPMEALDCGGNQIIVTSVTMPDTWPGPCVLTLSGIPATPEMVLVFSGMPNPQVPVWFPVDALKDQGYTHIWYDIPPCGGYPPSVSIESPWNGEIYEFEAPIWFTAYIYDQDDVSFPPEAVVWTSSLVGQFGIGTEFSYDVLPSGTHDITVTVTDKDGNTASASVTVTINEPVNPTNTPPAVSISSPSPGAIYYYEDDIPFEAWVYDEEDGDLPSDAVVWTSSSLAEPFGTGTAFYYYALPPGTQDITVTVTDSDGNTASASVTITINEPTPTNNPPMVTMLSPLNWAVYDYNATIEFEATAYDDEDGTLTGDSIVWTELPDGLTIGTGEWTDYGGLSAGEHTITVTVTDSRGNTGSTSVTITVNEPPPETDNPPVVTIMSPTNGDSFEYGMNITFSATVFDEEDGSLPSDSIVWTLSAGGQMIGTGETVYSDALPQGPQTITVTATDSAGNTVSADVNITILEPAGPPPGA
ncbi:MAG: putative Ig domain-containing protein [bacterium]